MNKKSRKNKKSSDRNDFIDIIFSTKNRWWFILALVVITFAVFSPTLNNDFVRWDDNQYVTENELIKEISIDELGKFGNNVGGNFHPLTMISLALDYHFFGLNPFYFHLKSLLFHLFNTILVFFFILKISKKNVFVSFSTALLFGIHPMHVESVAWVSERKDVLFSFYFLAGLLLYYEYRESKKIIFYFLAIVSFLLSALAKSAAVVFPVILLLVDFYENKKLELKSLLQKIPFFAISLWIGIIALNTQSEVGALEKNAFSFFEKLKVASGGNFMYFKKFFAPSSMVAYYPIPNFNDNSLFYLFSILFSAFLIFIIVKLYKKQPWVSWGLAFYFVTIILVLQFLQVGGSFIFDRYTYLPYIGLGFVYFTFFSILFKEFKRIKSFLITVLILQSGFWAFTTYVQTKVWTNTETLWTNFIDEYPLESSNAHNNLGEYYYLNGDSTKALSEYNKSIEIDINNYRAYTMRGRFYFESKQYELAKSDFSKALSIKTDYVEALKGRSAVSYFQGQLQLALEDVESLLELDNLNFDALNHRGNIYIQQNKLDLALNDFNKAISINKNFQDAINNKALVLALMNDSTAINQFNAIVENDPTNYVALSNRGAISYTAGKLESALQDFNHALQLKENYSEALKGRSAIYYDQKEYLKAIPDITTFLNSNPENYDMLNRRALCYLNTNQHQKAINDFNSLIEINPNDGSKYQGRGFMYIRLGNLEKAREDIILAKELGIEINPNILEVLQIQ